MRGMGDKHDTWAVVARKGRSAASKASTAESHTGGQHAACEAPKQDSPSESNKSSSKRTTKKKKFETVFSNHPTLQFPPFQEESVPTVPTSCNLGCFVAGEEDILERIPNKVMKHQIFPGVFGAWVPGPDHQGDPAGIAGKAFIKIPAEQHAVPGSKLRADRGVVTVSVPHEPHRACTPVRGPKPAGGAVPSMLRRRTLSTLGRTDASIWSRLRG